MTAILSDLKPGAEGVIKRVIQSDDAVYRLEEIGFLEGRTVRMLKIAPLGDPVEVRVLNADFCLRKREAALILVDIADQNCLELR